MRILAIDLSLTATGICDTLGRATVREWAPVPKHKGAMTPQMVGQLHRDRLHAAEAWMLTMVMETGLDRPDLIVMEGYSFGSKDGQAFSRAEIRGVLRSSATRWGVPFVEIDPSTLKMFATGRGNAPKPEVISNIRERFGYEGYNDNEADAIALWHMAHQYLNTGQSTVKLPQAHTRALTGKIRDIDWQGVTPL